MLVLIVTRIIMVPYANADESKFPPVLLRLSCFEEAYKDAIAGKNDLIIQKKVRSNSRDYIVYWDTRAFKNPPPGEKLKQVLSSEKLAGIASEFLRQNLDKDLIYSKMEPISVMQFQVSTKIGKISFFEYMVNDKTPHAGMGFVDTIIVPLTASGQILCKITSSH